MVPMQRSNMQELRVRVQPPQDDNHNNNKDDGNGPANAINPLNKKSRHRNGVSSHRYCHSHGHYDKRFVAVIKMASLKKIRLQWKSLLCCTRCLWATVAFFFCLNVVISIIDSSFRSYGTATSVKMTAATTHEDTFSVVINTYKRPQMLKKAVRHYAETCGRSAGVARVYIIWADLTESPPGPNSFFDMTATNNNNKNERPQPTLQHLKGNAFSGDDNSNSESSSGRRPSAVQMVRVANDSLNSRFLPLPQEKSNSSGAIFMVDDDVLADCFSVQQAFYAWKSRPTAMAGFYPRLAAPSARQQHHQSESSSKSVQLVYHAWPVLFWRQQMNFVLTKAAFLHKRYLDLYTADTHPQAIKDYVDTNRNCEDVAMAMLIANVTKAEAGSATTGQNAPFAPATSAAAGMPIYVQGKVTDLGLFNGISTGKAHMKRRSDCLNDLTRIYQEAGWSAPLGVSNNAAAGDEQKQSVYYNLEEASWVHHSPGFWWQLRPSNVFEWAALNSIFY